MVGLTDEQLKSLVEACFDKGGKVFAQRLSVQIKELDAEKFGKKRKATDSAAEETVALEVSKQAKVSLRSLGTRFEQLIKDAGNWELTMAVDYPEVTEEAPILVGMVARDPSLDYHMGVKKIIETMNQWDNLGYRCQGKVVAHKIALAVLSCQYDGSVKQFREEFGIRTSTMKFHRTGATRMATLAVEVSPGLWSCPAVIGAWNELCRMKETTFKKHLQTLKNCVVVERLENDSVRDHLDAITKYAKECLKLLPPPKKSSE
ncbi:hypothetical protein [Absidia glauca]|uniref:Uncharacterized protein n=1 Tax=Absidia glauca TaxID=4829 RepID=A0A168TD72_ABSGL|nr:hypothetical protein [Absidia glauca]